MSTIHNKLFRLLIPKDASAKNDILSGITVALALVPEAIAFAFVAKVPPVVGLYAAFMMGLITAIFGGRPGMISGATGAVAVIFAHKLIEPLHMQGITDWATIKGYLFASVMVMGVMQIIFGLLKLGKFIRLVPHPVMLGFVNGLAIIIFKAQLGQFTTHKIDPVTGEKVLDSLTHQPVTELLEPQSLSVMVLLVALTMAISHFLPKITKAVPATLVAIISVTGIALLLDSLFGIHVRNVLDYVQANDSTVETLKATLPTFAIPKLPFTAEAFKLILPAAAIAAAVGLIESLMTLTLVDDVTETRGRGNKECIGQGLANFTNGLFGGMGGCAMIGQSMINIRAGGRGRLSGITAGLGLLFFILFGSKIIEVIPLAALVGVMFMVVIGTFEWATFRIIPRIPKEDAFVIILVSVVTVLTDLAIAVFIGIIVSALVFAWKQGKNIHHTTHVDEHGTKIYTLEGPIFFGSATKFRELFDFSADPEDVVINFESSRVYDHSGIEALNFITEKYGEYSKKLHLLNLSEECKQLLNTADNIVEIKVIEDLEWHLADDALE